MPAGHRHQTDRVDGVIVAECTDCGEYSATVEYGSAAGDDVLADLKTIVGEQCHHCGADIAYMDYEEPSEVLD
jgi:hypothetical protein